MTHDSVLLLIFATMRFLLYPFAVIWWLVISLRRAFYQWGIFKRRSFQKPVICIGNLSVGGTGKSPMVIYLAKLLANQSIATLSRGYGRKTRGFRKVEITDSAENTGDEPLMFAHTLPQARIFVGENRCAAMDIIYHDYPDTEVILLDDAYQHMAVNAGLNILITRHNKPFWKDHLLPAGTLREPANGAARAQAVVVTGCDPTLSENDKKTMRQKCAGYTKAEVFFAGVSYTTPVAVLPGQSLTWKNKYDSMLVLSGIAHPHDFQQQAKTYANHVTCLAFSDHYQFSLADCHKIIETYNQLPGEKAIITTAKDRVRLLSNKACLNMLNQLGAVFYQPMELTILDDPKKFDQLVLQYAQTHS